MYRFKMFRYLEKYVGTYRVLAPYDLATNQFPEDEYFDDLYIPCSRGCIIQHTYENEKLALFFLEKHSTAKNVYKELKIKYPDIYLELEDLGLDAYIYFKDEDITKIATIVKPKTSGAKISPYSNRNLPKVKYDIPQEDLDKYNQLVTELTTSEKMHNAKRWLSEFDETIQKKMGKKFNIDDERKESRLGKKEFIHSIGLWDDYIRYVKKEVKKLAKA